MKLSSTYRNIKTVKGNIGQLRLTQTSNNNRISLLYIKLAQYPKVAKDLKIMLTITKRHVATTLQVFNKVFGLHTV